MERYQKEALLNDLKKKMVFLVGPRQAGKTWLAKSIAKTYNHPVYLNFDHHSDRKIIQDEAWLPKTDLLILDELHKMPQWKNYLKGLFDTKPEHTHILVTGSARMDTFRQAGDALSGRYFLHHLMPLSPAELHKMNQPFEMDHLIDRSGFPEPYLAESQTEAKRWRLQYVDTLMREEIFDINNIQNIKNLRLVFELLREKVGSPVTYSTLAEDANIAPNTVKKYIQIFESLYIIFRVKPYSKNIARSLLKSPKIYFFDTGLVNADNGAKLENLTAVSLLKHAYSKQDYLGQNYELFYLRTKENKEVDFALAHNNKIETLIEVKTKNKTINPALSYFHKKYNLPAIQLVYHLEKERLVDGIKLLNLTNFLKSLDL